MKDNEELSTETSRVVESVLVSYDAYLDSMIAMFESMLTPEQLEEVEKEFQQRKLDGLL